MIPIGPPDFSPLVALFGSVSLAGVLLILAAVFRGSHWRIEWRTLWIIAAIGLAPVLSVWTIAILVGFHKSQFKEWVLVGTPMAAAAAFMLGVLRRKLAPTLSVLLIVPGAIAAMELPPVIAAGAVPAIWGTAVSMAIWLTEPRRYRTGCPHCGYSRAGLQSGRCPECGTTQELRTS